MALEVEDRLLAEAGGVEIAGVHEQLVLLGAGLGDDLAVGVDDDAAAEQRVPVLDAGLGHGHHPGRVLIGAGLQRELVVEDALLGPSSLFCELTEGVLKPSTIISTPCRPITR